MTSSKVIGVTVGVGYPHEMLASLAASCFSHYTRLPSVVIGNDGFASSCVSHPAAIRLKLFEIFNLDRIIYFDADWFCMNDWNPPLDNHQLLACRDFILTKEWPEQKYDFKSSDFSTPPNSSFNEIPPSDLRHNYISNVQKFADIHLQHSQWINSGLLILNRTHHQPLLKLAYKLYTGAVGHHEEYYEQPALVKAIELLGIEVQLLARNLNVLAAFEKKWPNSIKGLHIKPKRHPIFLEKLRKGSISSPEDVHNYFIEE